MNNVQLSGRLVKDPDVRWTNSGKQVCTFTIASQRPFKNANGEYDADFVNCMAWEKTAEMIGNYFSKGDSIMIPQGRIQVRSYDTDNGKRWVTEVVVERVEFMESKKNKDARQNGVGARSDEQQGQRNNSYSQRNSNAASAKSANNQQSCFDGFGQQIPFDEVIPF